MDPSRKKNPHLTNESSKFSQKAGAKDAFWFCVEVEEIFELKEEVDDTELEVGLC